MHTNPMIRDLTYDRPMTLIPHAFCQWRIQTFHEGAKQLEGLGNAVSSPSGVWGAAPAEIDFGPF